MVVEYVRYVLPAEQCAAFEQAYAQAQSALQASEHCLGYELSRCIEEPTMYILRIKWDSVDGHMQGFRTSTEFRSFFAAVRPFVEHLAEMRHYEVTSIKAHK